jgi:hypothetical protein
VTREIRNIGASVRARLANLAREQGADFQRILQRYAIERLLARLASSDHRDEFVLKGAMLYIAWGGGAARPTRDLDLLGYGPATIESVRQRFRAICSLPSEGDGIDFDVSTIEAEAIREDAAYGGVRVWIDARLEQARVRVQIDVAFGEAVVPAPDEVEFPPLLGGSGPRLRAYPHEVVLAEKFHAAVVLGETNSRLKDIYDLCALPTLFAVQDEDLARALVATFTRRKTPLPDSVDAALPATFFSSVERGTQWRALLDRDSLRLAPGDLGEAGEAIRRAFAEALDAARADGAASELGGE